MKFLFLFSLLFFTATIATQNTFKEADAIAIVDTFLKAFYKGDALIMNFVLFSKATLYSTLVNTEGVDVLEEVNFGNFKAVIAARLQNQVWKEKN